MHPDLKCRQYSRKYRPWRSEVPMNYMLHILWKGAGSVCLQMVQSDQPIEDNSDLTGGPVSRASSGGLELQFLTTWSLVAVTSPPVASKHRATRGNEDTLQL